MLWTSYIWTSQFGLQAAQTIQLNEVKEHEYLKPKNIKRAMLYLNEWAILSEDPDKGHFEKNKFQSPSTGQNEMTQRERERERERKLLLNI